MGIPTSATPAARPDAETRTRLAAIGLAFDAADTTDTAAAVDEYARALDIAARDGRIAVVADRGTDRRDIADRMDAASLALRELPADGLLAVVVLPAILPRQAGPVAVLSPTGAMSSYEIYLGAAIAAAENRRVEHLNARGTIASAQHSGIAGRVLARTAAPAWHERSHTQPERALRDLDSRPAAIVVAVAPGSTDATHAIVDHPDADVFLVYDRVQAQQGSVVAQQASSMIELAFTLAAPAPVDVHPVERETVTLPAPTDDLPPLRASDVLHLRLTDTALELTNRTAQRFALRIALGSASEPDLERAAFACELTPGEHREDSIAGVAGIQDLKPPTAVLRHWSHESEEVYEGGELRMLELRVAVLDEAGEVYAEHAYRPGNGLDFFVTARDLTTLLRRPVARSVLPEPAPVTVSATPPQDLLGALASALAVGAGVLGARSR